ncbi:MAG: 16S rRNA (cytosine(1402)-N(4))-methyltransferase RsmH [Candidatus Zixiibacteriota bacterium]
MHQPVLVKEVVENLVTRNSEIIVDATVGTGGHAEAILKGFEGKLICLDRDQDALTISEERLRLFENRITFARLRFSQLEDFFSGLKIKQVSGFLFDLGLCWLHLSSPQRGFSFQSDGPLDMRMDQSQKKTAFDVINRYSLSELTTVLFGFGQERFSKKIARAIVDRRTKTPLHTTFQLRSLVESAVDPRFRIKSLARVFQALRMEVNDELNELKEGLMQAIRFLAPLGRLCVISYHSLEHRLVKDKFRQESRGCICPPDLPVCGCGAKATLRVLTSKPLIASSSEGESNPNSRSAKLWVAEKLELSTDER